MKIEMMNLFKQLNQAKKENNKQEMERIRNIIYEKNKGLILKLAIRDEDLKSECALKLLDIICAYDMSKGIEFSTYAMTSLKKYIKGVKRELNNQTSVPYHRQTLINRIINELAMKLNREPNIDEIYEEICTESKQKTKITKNEIAQIINASQQMLSLDYEDEESEVILQEVISNNENVEEKIEKRIMRKLILEVLKECLTEKQYITLITRYGFIDNEQKTYQEVAEELGDTRQRIHQLEKRALKKLRENPTIINLNPKRKCQ